MGGFKPVIWIQLILMVKSGSLLWFWRQPQYHPDFGRVQTSHLDLTYFNRQSPDLFYDSEDGSNTVWILFLTNHLQLKGGFKPVIWIQNILPADPDLFYYSKDSSNTVRILGGFKPVIQIRNILWFWNDHNTVWILFLTNIISQILEGSNQSFGSDLF